ncbi:MAG: DUF4259 domain-containing protein [Planctomycetaceae bacterium]|nr:DUF4259 domain-containing protein [Planctomycetaceae bacterium]
MGAWAEGVFDNDTAGDWADELARSDRHQNVADALTAVVQGSLGIDECFEALVAAEVVAAGRGWPIRGLYEPLKHWLQRTEYRPTAKDQRLALDAIAIIRDRSELADEIGQENKKWLAGLQKLIDRLNQKPKPLPAAKPRRILPSEVAAAIERLDLANNSIGLTKGGSVKSLHLCDHDDATLGACLPWLTTAKRLYVARWAKNWATNANEPIPTTDAAFTCLDQFSKLEELNLSCTLITDATLSRIAGLTKLKQLSLACTPITDAGLAHLSGLVNLEELDLGDQGRGNSRLTSAGLACLRDMTKLRTLNLLGTAADDSVLTLLSPMQNLGELDLRRTKVTGAGLVHLSNLLNLWFLELQGIPISDEHLEHLAHLTNLRGLSLSGRRITDKSLDTIVQLLSLESLGLEKATVTDEGLRKIAQLPKLKAVGLKGTDVTMEGARWLRQARPRLDVQGRNR